MQDYDIPSDISVKCRDKYGFDIEEAVRKRVISGVSMSALSEEYGVSRGILSRIFKKIGVDTSHTELGQQHLIDQDWLLAEYVDKKRTIISIAKELGVDKGVVQRLISKIGLKQEKPTLCEKYGIDAKWLRVQIEQRNRTFASIAEELGISYGVIRRASIEEGMRPDKLASKKRRILAQKLRGDLPELAEKNHHREFSVRDLCTDFDVNETTARRILAENDITLGEKTGKSLPFPERCGVSEAWIRKQRDEEHRSLSSIAKEIGCSKAVLSRFCRSIGCGGFVAPGKAIERLGIDDDWLVRQYIDEERSFTSIAKELGVNPETVSKYYKERSLPLRSDRDANFCEFYGVTQEWFVEQVANGRSSSSLAKEMGTTKKRVKRLKETYVSAPNRVSTSMKYDIDLELLRKMRIDDGMSLNAIAREFGVSRYIVRTACVEGDILSDVEKEEKRSREEKRKAHRARLYDENKWKHDKYLKEEKKRKRTGDINVPMRKREFERIVPLYEKYGVVPEIFREMCLSGKSVSEIGNEMGTSVGIIKLICYELGVEPKRLPLHEMHDISYEWFYDKRITQKMSFTSIAEDLGGTLLTSEEIYVSLGLDRVEAEKFLKEIDMDAESFLAACELPEQERPCFEGIDKTYLKFMKKILESLQQEKESVSQIEKMYKEGIPVHDMKKVLGLSCERIWRVISEHKMKKRTLAEKLGIDREWLYGRIAGAKSIKQVASELGTQPENIRALCVFWGIDKPVLSAGERNGVSYQQAKEIINTPNLSHLDIARHMGVSLRTSYKIMREYGLCPPRNHLRESDAEIKWQRFLDDLEIEYKPHQYFLPGETGGFREIDILIPEFNIGIEISPAYTHNSDVGASYGNKRTTPKPSTYHQKKSLDAEALGINLIHIFDWYDDEKLGNLFTSLLHKNEKVFARKTVIEEIDAKSEKEFFSRSHLQGYVKSQVCYALVHNGEIVCAMSFGKPRFGNSEQVQWELLRFASKPHLTVVGGASKLFAHFCKQKDPESIMSYCNYDISNGKMYETLGFEYVRLTRPSYYWMDANKRESPYYSWNLITSKGVDNVLGTKHGKGKSNIALMLDEGFVRVYNCGNKVYTWKKGK